LPGIQTTKHTQQPQSYRAQSNGQTTPMPRKKDDDENDDEGDDEKDKDKNDIDMTSVAAGGSPLPPPSSAPIKKTNKTQQSR
jgi:hypothetical protein